jgi:hypothetical protein
MTMVTLASALASGDLEPFIRQAEAAGEGPADQAKFAALLGAVTAPLQEDQTSRLPARGSSRGK